MSNISNSQLVPVLFAYLNTGVTNVTGNGTNYTVLYDTVGYGDSSNYSSGVYTVQIPGNYIICSGMTFNNIINSANNNLSGFSINGTNYRMIELSMIALKDSTNTYSQTSSIQFYMSAGQTISVIATINNGSAASVGMPGGTSPYLNWMFIRYLF